MAESLRPEKPRSNKKMSAREAARMALFSAVASFTMGDAPAHAQEPKKQPLAVSSQHKTSAKSSWEPTVAPPKLVRGPELAKRPPRVPADAHVPHAHKLSQEDVERIGVYQKLLKKMDGLRVESSGKARIDMIQMQRFCEELANVCETLVARDDRVPYDMDFTFGMFERISDINSKAFDAIKPMTDLEQHGITIDGLADKWDLATSGYGDCEDFAWLKYLWFVEEGFDPSKLHILVVHDENKEGHAVLGISVYVRERKQWGMLILDNKTREIRTLAEMEQRYKGLLASFLTTEGGKSRIDFYEYQSIRPASRRTVPGKGKGR